MNWIVVPPLGDFSSTISVGHFVLFSILILLMPFDAEDPRTCELLVPFVNPIVTRLASIGRFLAHTEDNTRHAMFSNCLAGVLIVVRFLLCCYCYVGHNATFLLFVLVSNRMTGKCLVCLLIHIYEP